MSPSAPNTEPVHRYPSDIAFTPTVKAMQERLGSRGLCARMERDRGWGVAISPEIKAFIGAQTSIFSRHRECARAAVHPASRRPGRVPVRG